METTETVYKVWIEIEECTYTYDETGGCVDDQYQSLDLPFAATAVFDSNEKALEFATMLHELGDSIPK